MAENVQSYTAGFKTFFQMINSEPQNKTEKSGKPKGASAPKGGKTDQQKGKGDGGKGDGKGKSETKGICFTFRDTG